jgi:hypothetical protein
MVTVASLSQGDLEKPLRAVVKGRHPSGFWPGRLCGQPGDGQLAASGYGQAASGRDGQREAPYPGPRESLYGKREGGFGSGNDRASSGIEILDLGLEIASRGGIISSAREDYNRPGAGREGRAVSSDSPFEAAGAAMANRGLEAAEKQLRDKLGFLGRFEMGASFSSKGRLSGSATLLSPLYDRESALAFLQAGLRTEGAERLLGHAGLGYRRLIKGGKFEQMVGANLFVDYDAFGGHARASAGLEWRLESLRASANAYAPINGYLSSREHPKALARAASGYDLKVGAFLPFYPKLGFEAGFERWRGPYVGTFAEKAPAAGRGGAFSWAAVWKPWPTARVRLARGPGGDLQNQTEVDFTLSFPLGERAKAPGEGRESLMGSRYELVERDYSLPLQFKPRYERLIELLGPRGPGLFAFRVVNAFGRPLAGAEIRLSCLSAPVKVLDPETKTEREIFYADAQGVFEIALGPLDVLSSAKVAAQSGEAKGVWDLPLEGPSIAPSPAQRRVIVIYLGEESPGVHLFRALFDDGEPASGHKVAISTASGRPVLDPASNRPEDQFVTDEEGYIRIKLPSDSPGETVTLTPEGGEGSDFEIGGKSALVLKASTGRLKFMEESEVSFELVLNGQPLEEGANAELLFDSGELSGVPAKVAVGAGGSFKLPRLAALKLSQDLPLRARAGDLTSNAVSFKAFLTPGALVLKASESTLFHQKPKKVSFSLLYQGRKLPEGTVVAAVFDHSLLSGLERAYSLNGDSAFEALALSSLSPSGPLPVKAKVGEIESNQVLFGVEEGQEEGQGGGQEEPHKLTLAASKSSLRYQEPSEVIFSVYLDEQPLAAGETVSLDFDQTALGGLSKAYELKEGGAFAAPSLTALTASGPLSVSASAKNLQSNQVLFEVDSSPGVLTLSASRSELEFLEPALTVLTVLYNGAPLPEGTAVSLLFDSTQLSGLSGQHVLESGGKITAPALTALAPSGPLLVSAYAKGLTSSPASFGVSLAPGALTLAASKESLEFMVPSEVAFEVKYKGNPLPAGFVVSPQYDSSDFGGLAGSYALETGGLFSVSSLTAKRPDGPLSLSVRWGSLESGPASFAVVFDSAKLSLTAAPEVLELFVPERTVFSFKYGGYPLPAGTPFTLEGYGLENLPGSGRLSEGGTLIASNLTAVVAQGPLEVKGTAWGMPAGQARISVLVKASYLSGDAYVVPPPSIPQFNLDSGLKPCKSWEMVIVVAYRGRLMIGEMATITGFKFEPSSPVRTDQNGQVRGSVFFTDADEVLLDQMGTDYTVTVAGASSKFKGPRIDVMVPCN